MHAQGWMSVPGFDIECLVNEMPRDLAALFTSAEIREAERDNSEVIQLSARAAAVKRRLELFGLSRVAVLPEFERAREKYIQLHARHANLTQDPDKKAALEKFARDASALTLDTWCEGLRTARLKEAGPTGSGDTSFFGKVIIGMPWYAGLWLILNTCDAEEEFSVDVTEFVKTGMIRADELNHDTAIRPYMISAARYAPIIVLTEGPTDVKVLRGGCQILFPEMVEYVHFFDYAVQPNGGAEALKSFILSLAASGVANRIVAIFDNDAIGRRQYDQLRTAGLPANIRVLHYPELEFHRDYPTSSGRPINASGTGAAIELYLGADILTDEGNLIPLCPSRDRTRHASQWRISPADKGRVQKAFQEKLSAAQQSDGPRPGQDWSGIAAILEAIFGAFADDSVSGFPSAPNILRIPGYVEMP